MQTCYVYTGFNKEFNNQEPKLHDVVGPQAKQRLESLGRVARNIQERPAGSYVNETNSAVVAKDMAGKAVASYATLKTGLPANRALEAGKKFFAKSKLNKHAEVGAGIKKD